MSLYGSLTKEEIRQYQLDFTKGWETLEKLDVQCRQVAQREVAFNPGMNFDMIYNDLLCTGIKKCADVVSKMGESYRKLKLERFYENFEYGEI